MDFLAIVCVRALYLFFLEFRRRKRPGRGSNGQSPWSQACLHSGLFDEYIASRYTVPSALSKFELSYEDIQKIWIFASPVMPGPRSLVALDQGQKSERASSKAWGGRRHAEKLEWGNPRVLPARGRLCAESRRSNWSKTEREFFWTRTAVAVLGAQLGVRGTINWLFQRGETKRGRIVEGLAALKKYLCPPAASRRPGQSKNRKRALPSATTTGRRSLTFISTTSPGGKSVAKLLTRDEVRRFCDPSPFLALSRQDEWATIRFRRPVEILGFS